ncbi:MAG TPA: DUF58 domain-containing protein [Casimicrobiaceae bacterium]|nr:DUF58 domain-containing protein [Casimicrobiaceae bacterium]
MTAASFNTYAARWRQRAFRISPADREPVVLRHSRIYILPTRRGFVVLGTLLLMLLTSLNYGLSLGIAITFLVGGMMAAGLLHTFRNLSGIEVKPLAASDTFVGGNMVFTVALLGGAAQRYAIRLAAGPAHRISDLPAGAAYTVALEMPTTRRGRLPLGRITLSSPHPLGLWRGWAYVHFPLAGVVYPKPEASSPPLPASGDGPDAFASGRGEDADLAGVRDYQPGDPLQRVAWKAVARGAGWYTKSFEGTGGGGPVALTWDALPQQLDIEERLSRLTSWVLAAERAARPFSLRLPGFVLPADQGREHRRAALTALALFQEPA